MAASRFALLVVALSAAFVALAMAVTAEEDIAVKNMYALENWNTMRLMVQSAGGVVSDLLRPRVDAELGVGLVATEDIAANTRIILMPSSLILEMKSLREKISIMNKKKEDPTAKEKEIVAAFRNQAISDKTLLALLVAMSRTGADDGYYSLSNFQSTVLDHWPNECATGFRAPAAVRKVLPPWTVNAIESLEKAVDNEIALLRGISNPKGKSIGSQNPSAFKIFGVTAEEFDLAYCLVESRYFNHGAATALVPLLDYFNHCGRFSKEAGKCENNVNHLILPSAIDVRTSKAVRKGEQLFSTYGSHYCTPALHRLLLFSIFSYLYFCSPLRTIYRVRFRRSGRGCLESYGETGDQRTSPNPHRP